VFTRRSSSNDPETDNRAAKAIVSSENNTRVVPAKFWCSARVALIAGVEPAIWPAARPVSTAKRTDAVPRTMSIKADIRNVLPFGGEITAPTTTNRGATSSNAIGKWMISGCRAFQLGIERECIMATSHFC